MDDDFMPAAQNNWNRAQLGLLHAAMCEERRREAEARFTAMPTPSLPQSHPPSSADDAHAHTPT